MTLESPEGAGGALDPSFAKNKFHVTHERDAVFETGLRDYFDYRDLGMVEATGGKLRAHVIRPSGPFEKRAICTITCWISKWCMCSRVGPGSTSRA